MSFRLGVRFVAQDTTIVPSQASVPLPTLNVSAIPPLEYREVFQWQQQFEQNWTMHRRLNHVLAGMCIVLPRFFFLSPVFILSLPFFLFLSSSFVL